MLTDKQILFRSSEFRICLWPDDDVVDKHNNGGTSSVLIAIGTLPSLLFTQSEQIATFQWKTSLV